MKKEKQNVHSNRINLIQGIVAYDDVKTGMVSKILAFKAIDIADPMSTKSLGLLDREKVQVIVSEVHNKFSICRAFNTRFIGGSTFYELLNATTGSLTQNQRRLLRH